MPLKKSFKKFSGSTGIEDALGSLNKSTQEAVEIMKTVGTEEEKR